MDMQNILNKLSALTTESLALAGGSHAPAELDESPMGRRAPAEPHTCETCGRPMPNWEPGDSHECDECEAGMGPDDSDPDQLDEYLDEGAMCEVCGEKPCVCESAQLDEVTALGDRSPGRVEPDDPSLRDDKHLKKIVIPSSKCLELVAKDFEGDEGYAWSEFEKIMQHEVPGWKTADWEWDVEVNDSNITVYTQEKEYSGDDDDLLWERTFESTRCEVCGEQPCVCESAQLGEAKVKNYYAVATAAIKKKYDLGPGKVDLTDAQTAEAHKLAKKLKKDDKKLTESEQDGSAELARMKQMMECWEPMTATQTSGMNVTTNLDSKTGNKTVTVTADGAGAEDLMKILTMAGIAVAPAPVVAVGEQLANEPAPATLDAQTQLVGMSGGPNAPHGQYNPDRARDNSMSMVDEAVNQLAVKLKRKFQNQ